MRRPLASGGSARRGAALPAHERRLLLPLGAHRAVGLALPADARLPVVPRRRPRAAAGSRSTMQSPRCSGPATSRSCRTARATACAASRDAGARVLDLPRDEVSDRYEILRHGGGGAPTTLVCGAVRFDHPAAHTSSSSCRGSTSRRRLARSGVDAEHAAVDGRRGARAAARRRDRDHPARRHPRHPGHPRVDRERPGGANRWLGALQDPQLGRAIALIHRDPARAWTSRRWRTRSRCRARRSRRGSPSSSASRRCTTSRAGGCTPREAQGGQAPGRRARQPARLPVRGRVQPRVQTVHRRPAGSRQTTRCGPRIGVTAIA